MQPFYSSTAAIYITPNGGCAFLIAPLSAITDGGDHHNVWCFSDQIFIHRLYLDIARLETPIITIALEVETPLQAIFDFREFKVHYHQQLQKRQLTILSQVLTITSRGWGISIPQNPVSMTSFLQADKVRTRRSEEGEKKGFLQSSNPELHRIIVLVLDTGMRRGEILNIKNGHINFNKSVLFIPSTKTDTRRTIPLFSKVMQ